MRDLYRAKVQNQLHTKRTASQTSQAPIDGSHGVRPILWLSAEVAVPEVAGSLLKFFKEGHSGLGALQSEFEDSNADRSSALGLRLFNGIVLATGATPV